MEILYTTTSSSGAVPLIFLGVLGLFTAALCISGFRDHEFWFGIVFMFISIVMLGVSVIGLVFFQPEEYVYARIEPDAPYVEIVEQFEYQEHQADVYRLKVLNREDQ